MRNLRKLSPVIALLVLLTSCGSSFSSKLRLVLLAAPPLVESLPVSPALKAGLITDFTDMADRTAGLSECISAATSKAGKLGCVQNFQAQIEAVISRGNFGNANNTRLNQILSVLRGIIASARIYYGEPAPAAASAGKMTEASIKAQIAELERLMKP